MALTVTMRCDVCGETRECDDTAPGAAAAALTNFAEAHSCLQHGRKRLTFSFAPESPTSRADVREQRFAPDSRVHCA